jgi:hypothetical protein
VLTLAATENGLQPLERLDFDAANHVDGTWIVSIQTAYRNSNSKDKTDSIVCIGADGAVQLMLEIRKSHGRDAEIVRRHPNEYPTGDGLASGRDNEDICLFPAATVAKMALGSPDDCARGMEGLLAAMPATSEPLQLEHFESLVRFLLRVLTVTGGVDDHPLDSANTLEAVIDKLSAHLSLSVPENDECKDLVSKIGRICCELVDYLGCKSQSDDDILSKKKLPDQKQLLLTYEKLFLLAVTSTASLSAVRNSGAISVITQLHCVADRLLMSMYICGIKTSTSSLPLLRARLSVHILSAKYPRVIDLADSSSVSLVRAITDDAMNILLTFFEVYKQAAKEDTSSPLTVDNLGEVNITDEAGSDICKLVSQFATVICRIVAKCDELCLCLQVLGTLQQLGVGWQPLEQRIQLLLDLIIASSVQSAGASGPAAALASIPNIKTLLRSILQASAMCKPPQSCLLDQDKRSCKFSGKFTLLALKWTR